MTQIMIASGMSDGQIETAVQQLRAAMRKHRDEVQKDVAQQALGVDNLGMRMFVFSFWQYQNNSEKSIDVKSGIA